MTATGMALLCLLLPGPLQIGSRAIDYHFMFIGSVLAILGVQIVSLGLFARAYSEPLSWFTLERGLMCGLVLLFLGFAANLLILFRWIQSGFGPLHAVRPAILALTLTVVGAQMLFSSFFLDLLNHDHARETRT